MSEQHTASRSFSQSAAGKPSAWSGADLAVVEELFAIAQKAWPALVLSPERFGQVLARAAARLPGELSPARLRTLAASDLALAGQCLAGDAKAIDALDRLIVDQSKRIAKRFAIDSAEVAQLVRVHLLTRSERMGPRLAQYGGQGSLAAWVQVVASRLVLNVRRRDERLVYDEREFCEPIAASTPELRVLHNEQRDHFVSAFRAAYRELPEHDRTILKRYFVAKQTLARIGEELGVHTATAARRVTAARTGLLGDFRRRLDAALGCRGSETDGLMAILRSRLELSDATLLKSTDPTGSDSSTE